MLICEWRGRECELCRSNCVTTVPWAKLWTKEYYYFDDEKTFPPINMRPNHTQRNRKCLHLENLFLCFSAPLLLCGLLPFQSAVLGHGSLQQQQQQQKRSAVVEWSGVYALQQQENNACLQNRFDGMGKVVAAVGLVVGNLFSTGFFFFLAPLIQPARSRGCV